MRGDTPLDYAEFQLSPKRTRCELFVSADGYSEKLASGFVKPFITHLRAAEVQISRGSQVIRLERQDKPSHTNNAWFSKGTLERFVRFVSTPEVIERVKTIEDELLQLEQVRTALANTFSHSVSRYSYGDSMNGFNQARDGSQVQSRSNKGDCGEHEGDASKRELLRAMEARLNALQQEQSIAFSRASAAGFDNKNIADLITFAQTFGADRLNDSCMRFLTLSKKRLLSNGGDKKIESLMAERPQSILTNHWEMNDDGTSFPGPKRRLDFGAKAVSPEGLDTEGRAASSTISSVQNNLRLNESAHAGGTFLTRLQHMAQKIEARSSDDFGWNEDPDWTEQPTHDSEMHRQDSSSFKESVSTSETVKKDVSSHSALSSLRVNMNSPGLSNINSAEQRGSMNFTPQDQESNKRHEDTSSTETNKTESNQNTKDEAPARRLSVQAAISLFESKKKDTTEAPPLRKLGKQESRKTLTEANSPSEKSVLRRWGSGISQSQQDNNIQEKNYVETERSPENDGFKAIKAALNNRFSEMQSQQLSGEQRKSLERSIDSSSQQTQRGDEAKPTNAESVIEKPIRPSDSSVQVTLKDHPNTEKPTDMVSSLKSKVVLTNTNMPITMRSSEGTVAENKTEIHPTPGTHLDSNRRLYQDNKEVIRVQSNKELQSMDNELVPQQRPKMSAQVIKENDINERIHPPMFKQERFPEKSSEATINESTVIEPPSSDNHTRKNLNSSKGTLPYKQQTSNNNSLTGPDVQQPPPISSPDIHMHNLVKIVQNQCSPLRVTTEGTPDEQRGRYYDQYSRLRDAKLIAEDPAKRAEREAKLKSMKETLEKRKAEMKMSSLTNSKRTTRTVSEKPQSQKTVIPVESKDEEEEIEQEETFIEYSSPASVKNRSSSMRSRATAKVAPAVSKSNSVPRNTIRAPTSSRKLTPKSDSSPVKTVSNTYELKKDATKTLSARVPSSARKPNMATDEASRISNGDTMSPRSMPRKNLPTISVSRSLPPEAVNGLMASLKDNQDASSDGKPKQIPQEIRPFLRKGRGIGPGIGPSIIKQKAFMTPDVSKNPDEDVSIPDGMEEDLEEPKSIMESATQANESDDAGDVTGEDEIEISTIEQVENGEMENLDEFQDASDNGNITSPNELSQESPQDATPEEEAIPQISYPNSHEKHAADLLSELLLHRNGDPVYQAAAAFTTPAMSFREPLIPPSHVSSPFNSVTASPAYISTPQHGSLSARTSPPRTNSLDSPVRSPSPWNTSQPKPASILSVPPKESSKGFKRLLHFGRKSKTTETVANDCVSVSTTSEGDDDADEFVNQPPDDFLRRSRIQRKGSENGNMGDHYNYPDQEPTQFFGSSIPPPPVNFKLREEQIKAPRSFFSLSPFRSKGTDAKSR